MEDYRAANPKVTPCLDVYVLSILHMPLFCACLIDAYNLPMLQSAQFSTESHITTCFISTHIHIYHYITHFISTHIHTTTLSHISPCAGARGALQLFEQVADEHPPHEIQRQAATTTQGM